MIDWTKMRIKYTELKNLTIEDLIITAGKLHWIFI